MDNDFFNNIDLNLYKVFLVVAEEGNISKAAKRLFVTQPAVSTSIKELEKRTNVVLFKRIPKGVLLTPDGKDFLIYIKNAFNNIYIANKILENKKNLETGEIRIGVHSHIGSVILTDAITKFNKDYPNIKFSLISKSSREMMNLLDEMKLDIVIDSFPIIGIKSFIDTHVLFEIKNCFVANSRFKDLIKNMPIPIEKLKELPLILPPVGSSNRALLEKTLNFDNNCFNSTIECYSSELIIDLVKKGVAIGFCPKTLVENELKSGELFEIFTETQCPTTQICLIYKPRFLTHTSNHFINMLKKISSVEYKDCSIEIINSKNIIIDPKYLYELYKVSSENFGVKYIHLYYKGLEDKIYEYIDSLNNISANINLHIAGEDLDYLDKNYISKVNNLIINLMSFKISIREKKLYYDGKVLDYVNYDKNIILEFDINDPKIITSKYVESLISTILPHKNITIQFNEPFVDEHNSHYRIRFIEKHLKEIGFIQVNQNTNNRFFSYKDCNVIIHRNFCAVCSSKFNPSEYCNKFNNIKIKLDGTLFLCQTSNKAIVLPEKFKNSDEIQTILQNALKIIGNKCKYEK